MREYFHGLTHAWDLWRTAKPAPAGGLTLKLARRPSYLGGPATKSRQLDKILAPTGASYSGLLCLSALRFPLTVAALLKRRGIRIVVNQNGVYYPAWYPKGWEKKNLYLQRLNAIADHTYFQSEFALESYKRWVGSTPKSWSILYNAVDLERFSTRGRTPAGQKPRILIFTDFAEINRKLWLHVAEFITASQNAGDQWEWHLAGRVGSEDLYAHLKERLEKNGAKIHWYEQPDPTAVAKMLASVDIAFHLFYNDVCPNKVLEAMASGVHVVTVSAGGSKELVGDAGQVLLVKEGLDIPEYPTSEMLRQAVKRFMMDPAGYSAKARARAEQFGLDSWFKKLSQTSWIKPELECN